MEPSKCRCGTGTCPHASTSATGRSCFRISHGRQGTAEWYPGHPCRLNWIQENAWVCRGAHLTRRGTVLEDPRGAAVAMANGHEPTIAPHGKVGALHMADMWCGCGEPAITNWQARLVIATTSLGCRVKCLLLHLWLMCGAATCHMKSRGSYVGLLDDKPNTAW